MSTRAHHIIQTQPFFAQWCNNKKIYFISYNARYVISDNYNLYFIICTDDVRTLFIYFLRYIYDLDKILLYLIFMFF